VKIVRYRVSSSADRGCGKELTEISGGGRLAVFSSAPGAAVANSVAAAAMAEMRILALLPNVFSASNGTGKIQHSRVLITEG
jgi:hypothetical protein